jgi:hypothetical protein
MLLIEGISLVSDEPSQHFSTRAYFSIVTTLSLFRTSARETSGTVYLLAHCNACRATNWPPAAKRGTLRTHGPNACILQR